MSNSANIDLKANPTGLKTGVGEARKEVEKFVDDSIKHFEALGLSSKELEEKLKELRKTLADMAKEDLDTAKSSKALTLDNALLALTITSLTGILGKFNFALAATEVGGKGLSLILNTASKEVTVLNDRLNISKKLMQDYAGDVEGLEAHLKSLGVTAEDVGLKIENGWSRVSKETSKLKKELSGSEGLPKMLEDIGIVGGRVADQLKHSWTGFANYLSDKIAAGVKSAKDSFKGIKDQLASDLSEFPGLHADDTSKREQEGGAEEHRKAEAEEKLQALIREGQKESLEALKRISDAKIEAARIEQENIKVSELLTKEAVEKELQAVAEKKKVMLEANTLAQKEGQDLLALEMKLEEQMKAVGKANVEAFEEMAEFAEAIGNIEKSYAEQAKWVAIQEQGIGNLKALLSDAADALEEIRAAGDGNSERGKKALEEYEKLRSLVHNQELKDIREKNDLALDQINKELAAKKAASERVRDIENARFESNLAASLKMLEAQGASEEILHKTKLEFMDKAHERAMEQEKDEEKRRDMAAQHQIAKAKEVADVELKAEMEKYKIAEIGNSVTETKLAAEFKKKLAGMELEGAKQKEIHEARLKHIDEEEKRELAKTKNDVERAAIRANAEKARIQEKTDFEISEMKRIKDLENDVKSGKISYAEGLSRSGMKPLTRKEQNERLKANAKARREAVAKAKEDKKTAAATKALDAKLAAKARSEAATKQNKAKAEALSKAKRQVEDRRDLAAMREHNAKAETEEDKYSAAAMRARSQGSRVKGIAGEVWGDSNKVGTKGGSSTEDLLKEIRDAAKTTNVNEEKLIHAMETAGGLA